LVCIIIIVEIRERVCGHDHPHTAFALNNMAVLFSDQRRFDDAAPFSARANEIFSKVLSHCLCVILSTHGLVRMSSKFSPMCA
jgi:hypothetical protein